MCQKPTRPRLRFNGTLPRLRAHCPPSSWLMRARRVCSTPGCAELTNGGRCADCIRAADRKRGSGTARGYTRQWERFRTQYLRQHPTCAHCGRPATDIDHIDGCGRNGPRAYDLTNLRPLCHSCHSKRTAQDQPGGWNTPGG